MDLKLILPIQSQLLVIALILGSAGIPAAARQPSDLASPSAQPDPQLSSATHVAIPNPIIASAKIKREGEKAVVHIVATGPLVFQQMRLINPDRLVFDFPGAHVDTQHWPTSDAVLPVRDLRAAQFKSDVARVVIDLDRPAPYITRTLDDGVSVEFEIAASVPTGSPATPPAPSDQSQRATNPLVAKANTPAPAKVVGSDRAIRSDPSKQAAVGLAGRASPETGRATFKNSFEDGILTYHAQNQPLRSLLKEIGDKEGVAIFLAESLNNIQTSVEFRGFRLDDALRQMLKDYGVFFFYGPDKSNQTGTLRAVWIYAPGDEQAPHPLPEITAHDENETAAKQTLPDTNVHAEVMTAPKASDPLAELLKTLEDPSNYVREQALTQALTTGPQVPQETLVNLALTDVSPKVRLMALEALPTVPELRWVLDRAANDWDQSVSAAASRVIREMDSRNRAETSVRRPPPAQQ